MTGYVVSFFRTTISLYLKRYRLCLHNQRNVKLVFELISPFLQKENLANFGTICSTTCPSSILDSNAFMASRSRLSSFARFDILECWYLLTHRFKHPIASQQCKQSMNQPYEKRNSINKPQLFGNRGQYLTFFHSSFSHSTSPQ